MLIRKAVMSPSGILTASRRENITAHFRGMGESTQEERSQSPGDNSTGGQRTLWQTWLPRKQGKGKQIMAALRSGWAADASQKQPAQ